MEYNRVRVGVFLAWKQQVRVHGAGWLMQPLHQTTRRGEWSYISFQFDDTGLLTGCVHWQPLSEINEVSHCVRCDSYIWCLDPQGGWGGVYWNTKPYALPGSNSLENKALHCIGGPEIYCIHWPLLKKTSPDGGQTGSVSCAAVTCAENVAMFQSRPQGVEGLWGGKKCRWWNRIPQTPLKH